MGSRSLVVFGRRLAGAVAVLATALSPLSAAQAQAPAQDQKRSAISLIGEPKMPANFTHFDWVNPNAPKGGRMLRHVMGSFDSLNPHPAQGAPASGLGMINEHLFAGSPDESSTEYALIAEWISYPLDFSSVTFGLRPEAKFHDGKQITADDVVFSFEALKAVSPMYSTYYKNVVKAEKTSAGEVKFTFDVKDNRELPLIVSQLPILPKHWWTANGPDGKPRDIAKSTTEPPLGSGPYKVKSVDLGRSIVYERVKNYWGANLAIMKGQWNFDELVFTYYRDRTAPFEAFKVGDIDFRNESSAKDWATEYVFDAVKKGVVKLETVPVKRVAPMQAWVMNGRKPMFKDVRVRRAVWLAFDFEEANKKLFYDQYTRLKSYFDNSELASSGLPQGRELEILTEVKDSLPAEVFTTEWKNPVNAAPEDVRKTLGMAAKLLAEAGYTNKGGVLHNAQGQPLGFEILLPDPSLERIAQPYKASLEKLGFKMTLRIVDSAQYQRRHDEFDYDMIFGSFAQSESPGNEQRNFFGSGTVDSKGSYNTAGIANKAIDHIIEKVVFAKDRAELVAATRALDRALLWNFYTVPGWHMPAERIAFWDRFGRPPRTPSQAVSAMQTWWVDPSKDAALTAARGK